MAMRRIVGKGKKKAPPPSLDETSKRMEDMAGGFDAKIKREENELKKIKVKLKNAKGAAKANLKRRALIILKRLKKLEQHRDTLANQQFTIDEQNFNLESMKATVDTVSTMKQTKKVMKKQMKKINIDKVEDLKDDIDDIMLENEEIQEVLGQNDLDDIDEADLDAELDALDEFDDEDIDELDGENVPGLSEDSASALPAVPSGNGEELDEFGLPAAPVPEKQATSV